MTTKHAPAGISLPWEVHADTDVLSHTGRPIATTHWQGDVGTSDEYADAAYIAHAANAYQRLVAHLREVLNLAYPITAEDFAQNVAREERDAYALLHELGEL